MTKVAAGLSWRTGRGTLHFDMPRVMGILNVTPDSFYDGGRHASAAAALHQAEAMLADGADLIDVGGESTRPGAQPIGAEEELRRVVPVVREIARRWPDVVISVDTVKSEIAAAVADAGAAVINDVSGLRLDARIAEVVATRELGLVLMHSRGAVSEMARYETADYGADPVGEIARELRAAARVAADRGVAADQLVLDPGVGFSKRTEHSVAVLARLDRITELGYPVLVGPSRKRFIGELSGGLPPEERLEGTLGAIAAACARGAVLFRVHDVRAARRALTVAHAILSS
ncbi:MAG: dihydropteroate synthase [Gemmatimonadota bacterium]